MKNQSSKSGAKRPKDVNQLAHYLVNLSTEEPAEGQTSVTRSEVSRVMSAMGRKGGKVGGKRRAEVLDQKRRSEIASQAAKKRWSRKTG
jgi:hypothetical protein